MYYTPGQVAEMLEMPPSTLRNYAKRFEAYLSPQGGRKQRLYTEKDLLIFAQIKDLSAANIPLDLIGPRLVTEDQPPAKPQDTALSLIPSVAAEIESAQASARLALSNVEQLSAQLSELKQQQEKQAAQLAKYQKYFSRPWWKRLFTKPPTAE